MLVWNYLSLKACKITHFYIKCAGMPQIPKALSPKLTL